MDHAYPLNDTHKAQLQAVCTNCERHIGVAKKAQEAGLDTSKWLETLGQQHAAAKSLLSKFFPGAK